MIPGFEGSGGPAAEVVVEPDAGGEREEFGGDSGADAVEGAGVVAFKTETVFEGPEDALDALTDRRDVRARSGLVLAARADDRRAKDSVSHAAISGICVQVFDGSGNNLQGLESTNASGMYTVSKLYSGSDRVEFSTGCGALSYVTQFYKNKPTLATANPVAATAGVTTSGINAAMVKG